MSEATAASGKVPKLTLAQRVEEYQAKLREGKYSEAPELIKTNLKNLSTLARVTRKATGTGKPDILEKIEGVIKDLESKKTEIPALVESASTTVSLPLPTVIEGSSAVTEAGVSLETPVVAANHTTRSSAVNIGNEDRAIKDPEIDPLLQITEKIKAIDTKLAECQRECSTLTEEKKALESFRLKSEIDGISLPIESKLFDLLKDRILDPSDDWASRLETLINIPHSLKGLGYLRGGDYFEAMFQIAIAIGELPLFRDKFIQFYDITKDYKSMDIKPNYLYTKTIKNSGGGEQGISDITFQVSNTPDFKFEKSSSYKCGVSPKEDVFEQNPYYFISVKGFKKEKSPSNEYDVPLLNLQLTVFPDIKHKYIIVCVRNKAKFLEKLTRTKMDMLKNSIHTVIGYDDLINIFTSLRIKIFTKLGSNKPEPTAVDKLLRSLYPENKIVKPMLSLYFHQELVVDSVITRIKKEENRDTPHYLCIGVLPRGGKSFIAGGIINKHKELRQIPASAPASTVIGPTGYNVLFLTSAVNETRSQFREDLIKKFTDFADFQFIDLVNSGLEPEGVNNFYFMSRQLSTLPAERVAEEEGSEVSLVTDKKFTEINILTTIERKLGYLPRFDICFFDEAHIGISTDSVRKNFDSIFSSLPGIPIVLMTATYKRPSAVLRSNSDLFVWDLQDIKDMKSLPTLGLEDFIRSEPDILVRYPNAIEILRRRIAMGESLEQLAKPYLQFANPKFISLTFTPEDIQAMIRTGAGYNYMNAFEINQDATLLSDPSRSVEWMRLLRNREDSNRLLEFITPELEKDDTVFTGHSRRFRALNQIFRISQKNGSRPMQGRPFSILMFLPFRKAEDDGSKGSIRIGELCRIWASFMRTKRYWRDNFVFLTLSTYANHRSIETSLEKQVESGIVHREDHPKDLKDLIREVEREALKKDKGLVILSGDVAKMGISLPCVDVVFMMSNNQDADDIIQKMYRALTDDPPHKKDGFIVDLDLKRIVSAMFEYDLQKDRLRTSAIQLPSTEDRAIRLFNLCDWGQDGFIEDNTGITFDGVMSAIKDRIVTSLRNKVVDTVEKTIQKKQEDVFMDMGGFIKEIQRELSGTVKQKGRKGKTEKMLVRGSTIPTTTNTASSSSTSTTAVEETVEGKEEEIKPNTTVALPPILNEKEAQKRMFEIIQTFINTLVIRSAESWSSPSMNLAALMELYWKDKRSTVSDPICDCNGTTECKTIHKNMYELVFCELKAFAYEFTSPSVTTFNPDKHKKIIEYSELVLRSPLIEWNIYIEKLLEDLRGQSGGRRFRVTRKRNSSGISKGNGFRKTLQQRSRYHR